MASRVPRAPVAATRRLAAFSAIGVLAALVALAAPPAARAAISLELTPNHGLPGDTIVATASGITAPPGEVTFWWDGTMLLGVDPTIVDGQSSLTFQIPATTLGPHIVRACHGSSCPPGTIDDAEILVAPPPTPAPTPPPSRGPTPAPSATPTPGPSATPTPGPSTTPLPSPTASPGPGIPIPSFPLAGPTAPPTPLPLIAITPAPQPPSDEGAPETAFPNLSVLGIEVTQGIQNRDNDMPLVAGRRTYARVSIDVEGQPSWPNTWGALEARRGGQQVGWIWPENGPIIARAGGGDRTELDDSLQFRLPASWLSGTVTLTAFVFSYGIGTPFADEPDGDDNTLAETVTFRDGLPLTLHLAPLHLHRSFHASDVERIYAFNPGADYAAPGSNVGGTNRILAGIYRYLPISEAAVDALTTPVTPLGHGSGHEWDLGGPCKTWVVEWTADNHITIADWTVLMEDPDEIDPATAGSVTPDRPDVKVMDRTFVIDYFYPQEDGTGSLWGATEGFGPEPPPGAPAYAHRCLFLVPELHEPNETLALYRVFYDWADEREFFVGMIDPSLRTAFGGGIASGGTGSVSMRMTDSFDDAWTWWHSGAETIGHELAHKSGLGHVPCSDDDGDGVPDELDGGALDLTHPMTLTFPDCRLSEVDPDGYYGFDVYWSSFGLPGPSVISNDPAAPAPFRSYPLLAYQFPGWPDPFHYCRMLAYYGVTCSATALDLPWNPENPEPDGSDPFAAFTPPPAELEPGTGVALVAVTQTDAGDVTVELLARSNEPTFDNLEAIGALEARVAPSDAEPLRIAVLGPDGVDAWAAVLPLESRPHEFQDGPATAVVVVPMGPDATAVEVRGRDSGLMARVDRSDPIVTAATVAAPFVAGGTVQPDDEILVAFELGDAGGADPDRISFALLYAPDGEHWQVVAQGRTEREVRVRLADLPSGDAPTLRIVGFDGWSIVQDTVSVPALAAPRNAPSVRILAADPASYPTGAIVRLEATAFDLEDRFLPGEAIGWSSSLDGDLGTGGELATRNLSPGRHTITAAATDSDGLAGTASYVLEVDASVVETAPGSELEAAVAALFERLAGGAEPVPTSEDHPDFLWAPILGAGALVLLAAAVLVVQQRRLRRARPLLGHEAAHVRQGGQGAGATTHHGAGANELSMDDTAGKERGPEAGADGDVALKGSKIKEN